jgi:hypothetical protein
MVSASDLALILSSLAWPILVGVLLIIYRKSISDFAKKLAPRVQGLTLGPVSFQFATATGLEITFASEPVDLGNSSALEAGKFIGGSGSENLLAFLDGPELDFVVFDLGDGDKWLTSRMYLFTVVLRQKRNLKWIVFVQKALDGKRNYFLGSVDPVVLASSLNHSYPWLDQSLIISFAGQANQYYGNRIDVWESYYLQQVIKEFNYNLELPARLAEKVPKPNDEGDAKPERKRPADLKLQSVVNFTRGQSILIGLPPNSELAQVGSVDVLTKTVTIQGSLQNEHLYDEPVGFQYPPFDPGKSGENNWINIAGKGDPELWEHAKWVDPDRLARILRRNDASLDTSAIRENEWLSMDKETKERYVLQQEHNFMVIVNDDGIFQRIIDKSKIVDRILLKAQT